MLDISIQALEKAIKSPKAAAAFIRKHIRVVEKIDGTKLTLVRNDTTFDPDDYTKNWIVSYKGNVIYPAEFSGLKKRDKDIKASALGTSQYKFVHDHLQSVHSGTGSIPVDTEFFIEFVQNKPTVTRDYAKKHGMFLVGFGQASYAVSKGQIYSSANFVDDPEKLEEYRQILQLGAFPLVYEGNLSSRSAIFEESEQLDPRLQALFFKNFDGVDFSDPQDILRAAADSFRSLESTLGGQAEGVVITVFNDDMTERQLYKVLAADQHDSEARRAKKERSKGTQEEENLYWNDINALSDELLDQLRSELPGSSTEEMLDALSKKIYSMREGDIQAFHPVKSLINKQEDLMLTAKTRLLVLGHRLKKIAVIPMAAKPFHRGHEALVEEAERDGNELIILYVSTGGREEISSSDMVPLWKKYYLPALEARYGDKVVVRFMGGTSPMYELRMAMTNFVRQSDETVVTLYGDEEDAATRVKSIVDNEKNSIDLRGRVLPGSVTRTRTSGISGTEMRSYLASGNKRAFIENLPDFLDSRARSDIWSSLSKSFAKNESLLLKKIIKLLM